MRRSMAAVSIVWGTILWNIKTGGYRTLQQPLSAGTKAPAFELTSLAGKTLSLGQFVGHPVVVMFWGSS